MKKKALIITVIAAMPFIGLGVAHGYTSNMNKPTSSITTEATDKKTDTQAAPESQPAAKTDTVASQPAKTQQAQAAPQAPATPEGLSGTVDISYDQNDPNSTNDPIVYNAAPSWGIMFSYTCNSVPSSPITFHVYNSDGEEFDRMPIGDIDQLVLQPTPRVYDQAGTFTIKVSSECSYHMHIASR